MNSGPGRIWRRGEHARLKKRWRCSSACSSKKILDRHHFTKLILKFYFFNEAILVKKSPKILSHGGKNCDCGSQYLSFFPWRAYLVVCGLLKTTSSMVQCRCRWGFIGIQSIEGYISLAVTSTLRSWNFCTKNLTIGVPARFHHFTKYQKH